MLVPEERDVGAVPSSCIPSPFAIETERDSGENKSGAAQTLLLFLFLFFLQCHKYPSASAALMEGRRHETRMIGRSARQE